jgi:hypothetical protein
MITKAVTVIFALCITMTRIELLLCVVFSSVYFEPRRSIIIG